MTLTPVDENTPLILKNEPSVYSIAEDSRFHDDDSLSDEGEPHEFHVSFDIVPEAEDENEEASRSTRPRAMSVGSAMSSVVEPILESIAEIKEVVVETLEEVQENIAEAITEVKEVIQEEVVVPVKPREEGDHSQKLSAIALAILVFYKVSGGPFGCEPAVKAGGPFFALAGFIVFPILWAIPEALITAELGSAYPEPSGAVAWVEEAFGPKAGLLCGYFHWVSGATDNAIYPSLFLKYVVSFLSVLELTSLSGGLVRFTFTVVLSIILALINYSGLEIVGNLAIVVCIISMSPFLIMCILGATKINTENWFVMPETAVVMDDDSSEVNSFLAAPVWFGVLWRPLLNSLFWNLNSFDVGASFAGEVRDPERVFPRAMFLSVVFVWLGYILPLLVGIGATNSRQEDWRAGYFSQVATEIGGPWLGIWTVIAAAVSNVALFEAEMSGDAYQLMGMADRGLIPKVFKKRSRFNTPTNGILLGTVVICLMSVADFDALVEMLNFAYCVSMLMEFAAFIALRITAKDMPRPYKIPLGTAGCIMFIIPPCLFCFFVMLVASKMTYFYFVLLVSLGAIGHTLQKMARHYDWWEYAEAPPTKRSSVHV